MLGLPQRSGLASLVRETMTADPFSGAVYVFLAKRADPIKLIFWDGTGLCLFAKRLEESIFRWPKNAPDILLILRAAALWVARATDLGSQALCNRRRGHGCTPEHWC